MTPIDDHRFTQNPAQNRLEELSDPIAERLYRVIPYDSQITDLHDYDYNVAEIAWEVEDEVADILLGRSKYDEDAACHLVKVYLEEANKFDIPLPTEFGVTEDEMRVDLKDEALKLLILGEKRY